MVVLIERRNLNGSSSECMCHLNLFFLIMYNKTSSTYKSFGNLGGHSKPCGYTLGLDLGEGVR
jgi:hypothetical protein